MPISTLLPNDVGFPSAPAGAIMAFATAALPVGWLECNGANYNRTDYPELFAALGGTSSPWGLPTGSTFSVPNLDGRTIVGENGTTCVFSTPLGTETVTLTVGQIPAHSHNRTESVPGGGAVPGRISTVNTQSTTSSVASSSTGGDGSHNNMQPSMPMYYGICTGRVLALQTQNQFYQIVTSSTRPGAPYAGMSIFETDTKRNYVYDGTTWYYLSGGTDPTAARAYASGTTSVQTTFTLIALAAEEYDYGNNFNTGTSTYTCPRAGLLDVRGRVDVASITDGQRYIVSIFKNGSEVTRGVDQVSGSGTAVGMGGVVADVIAVAANDAITLRAQMVTGTAKTTGSGTITDYMSCRMLP